MQNKVKEFNKTIVHKKPMPLFARLLDIQSELGELNKEYLKATNYGTKEFEKTDDFEMEFGDVLYALLSAANETGIDASLALSRALNKMQSRMQKRNNLGSGN